MLSGRVTALPTRSVQSCCAYNANLKFTQGIPSQAGSRRSRSPMLTLLGMTGMPVQCQACARTSIRPATWSRGLTPRRCSAAPALAGTLNASLMSSVEDVLCDGLRTSARARMVSDLHEP